MRAQLQRLLEEEVGRARAAEALAAYGGGGGPDVNDAEVKEGGAGGVVPASRIFAAEELHGDCSQGARSRALDAFASGACRVLAGSLDACVCVCVSVSVSDWCTCTASGLLTLVNWAQTLNPKPEILHSKP